ncbi:MAG: hypothetical protein MZW92_35735 [Comamonadaceae bacterium]|nr:hypothetical protein [Comamonadaceae bacterium]
MRASIALPGLFTPVAHEDGFLVDGGLVNPVPVSLCRAMGADVVIAVDLGSAIVGRGLRRPVSEAPAETEGELDAAGARAGSAWPPTAPTRRRASRPPW